MGRLELDVVSACHSREDESISRITDEEGGQVYIKMDRLESERSVEMYNGRKGVPQPRRCKDWTFAILFLFHVGLILYPFVVALNVDGIEVCCWLPLTVEGFRHIMKVSSHVFAHALMIRLMGC